MTIPDLPNLPKTLHHCIRQREIRLFGRNLAVIGTLIVAKSPINYCFRSNLDTVGADAKTRESLEPADMLTHMLDTDNSVTHFKLRPQRAAPGLKMTPTAILVRRALIHIESRKKRDG